MSARWSKIRLAIGLVVGLPLLIGIVLLASYAWLRFAPRRVPEGQPPLVTVEPGQLETVRDAFNASRGEVRVLAMLSPT